MKNQIWILGAALMLPLTAVSAAHAAPTGTGQQAAGAVRIVNTGTRLTPGYQATVEPDGILTAVMNTQRGGKTIHHTAHLVLLNRQRFFADLAKAEPLDKLSTGTANFRGRNRNRRRGFRSPQAGTNGASAFPYVFVQYQGRQSPNLRQTGSPQGQALYQDVKQILQLLRVPIPNVP